LLIGFSEGILKGFREAQIPIEKIVLSGSCESQEKYQRLTGILEGFKLAEEIVKSKNDALFKIRNVEEMMEGVMEDEHETKFY
jgi:hypothetical protein